MRLPIVVLLGVVAVSTVRAQKHDDRYCDFDGVCDPPDPPCGGEDSFECRSAIPKGLAPISGNNAAKEQEAVDKLAAIGLLNAISEVAENSPPEQTRGLIGKIINKAKNKAKGVIRRVKDKFAGKIKKYGLKVKCRFSCKPSCPLRYCKPKPKPRPRPIAPVYEPEPIDEPESDQLNGQGDYSSDPSYGADESYGQSENARFLGLGGLISSLFG